MLNNMAREKSSLVPILIGQVFFLKYYKADSKWSLRLQTRFEHKLIKSTLCG